MTIEDIVKEIQDEIKREWKSIPPNADCDMRHIDFLKRLIVKLRLLDTSKDKKISAYIRKFNEACKASEGGLQTFKEG
jgi:Mg2+ and Co2+ transporter CorA